MYRPPTLISFRCFPLRREFLCISLAEAPPLGDAKRASVPSPNFSSACRPERTVVLQSWASLSESGLTTSLTHLLSCLLPPVGSFLTFSASSVFAIEQSAIQQCGPHPTRPDKATSTQVLKPGRTENEARSPLFVPPLPPSLRPAIGERDRFCLTTVTSFRGFPLLPLALLQTRFSKHCYSLT